VLASKKKKTRTHHEDVAGCEEDATQKSPLDRAVPAMEGPRLGSAGDMLRHGLGSAEVSSRPSVRLVQARGAAQPLGSDERKKRRGAGPEEEEESVIMRKKKRTGTFSRAETNSPQYRGSRLCIEGEGLQVCKYPFGIGVDFQF
jgi:hypothetical protein